MNLASFLLCFVFAAIGYVAHPMILPKLVESDLVAESALSEAYKKKESKKSGDDEPKSEDNKKVNTVQPDLIPDPIPDPIPVPVPDPEPTPEPDFEPEPTLDEVEMPEPVIPSPVSEQPKVVEKLSDEKVISALQSSVKAGEVSEFTFDQVVGWSCEEQELIGSDTYDVGMVTFTKKSILDDHQLQAKALIRDGKVVKWIWPVTSEKMN